MIISLGSDHAGFEQKDALAAFLVDEGHDVIDRGPENDDRVDYPDYALRVARDVGMAMAADKVPGVRAANIVNTEFAALCREHNDANVLALSGRFVSLEDNKEIVRVFLSTAFGGGRHAQRVEKIMAIDEL